MTTQSHNFWNFSIQLYARPQVAESCLELQNLYGIDVNLLLYCYWHGLYWGEMPEATITRALAFSELWRNEVVQPLRNVRRWMKQHAAENEVLDVSKFDLLRNQIKRDELEAENYQQIVLQELVINYDLTTPPTGSKSSCTLNINKLLLACGISACEEINRRLENISQEITFAE